MRRFLIILITLFLILIQGAFLKVNLALGFLMILSLWPRKVRRESLGKLVETNSEWGQFDSSSEFLVGGLIASFILDLVSQTPFGTNLLIFLIGVLLATLYKFIFVSPKFLASLILILFYLFLAESMLVLSLKFVWGV